MKMWMNYVKTMLSSKKGQGMVEYGLIIGLIAVGVIAVLGLMGDDLVKLFDSVQKALSGAVAPAPSGT